MKCGQLYVNKLKSKNMIKLEDLQCYDEMYYVGDIIETDDSGWVTKEEALKVLEIVNTEH